MLADGQNVESSVSVSNQPDTMMRQSRGQPERPAYLKDLMEN